jgi:hypothetical protein
MLNALCYYDVSFTLREDTGGSCQIWKVTADMLNKHMCSTSKEWSFILWVGCVICVLLLDLKALDLVGSFGKQKDIQVTSTGVWNDEDLCRTGTFLVVKEEANIIGYRKCL